MIINLINKNSAKILLFLAISPGSNYSRKDIKEKTEMHNLPLDYALTELLNFKIIKRRRKLYHLNLENPFVADILEEIKGKFFNLPFKVQLIILNFISKISKLKYIKEVILFGSYSKIIYSEKSDIDISIIFYDNIKNKNEVEKKISLIAEKISNKNKKELQEHFFTESELKHKKDPLIKDILKNGRALI
jgi:predicted nucleotidyltransferase